MIDRHLIGLFRPAVSAAAAVASAVVVPTVVVPAVPSAAAAPCPDVQVVFARGTGEVPGVGPTGQAFVDSLRSRAGGKSFDVYPVDYPASDQWSTGVDGVRDAATHVISMAKDCPRTRMVLGGYSQGAAVTGFLTSATVPDGVDPASVPKPLDPAVAEHVSAVVLYGLPNARAMNFLGEPQVTIGPLYQTKTLRVCAQDDPVCSDGLDFAAHQSYAGDSAYIDQGANFAAARLGLSPQTPTTPMPAPTVGFGS